MMDFLGFHAFPHTNRCRDLLARHEHALIGISPGSSYFNTSRVTRLAQWAVDNFEDFHLAVLVEPFRWSLQAIGYPESHATRRAQKELRLFRGRCMTALDNAGVADAEAHVLTWRSLMDRSAEYRRLRSMVFELFESDDRFRAACLETSEHYLSLHELRGTLSLEERRQIGVRYFLEEIPLFLDTPVVLGTPSSVTFYHELIPFMSRLYRDEFTVSPAGGQGHAILTDWQDSAEAPTESVVPDVMDEPVPAGAVAALVPR